MAGTRKSAPKKPSRREVPETPDTVDALYPPLPERIPLTLESIAGDEPTYAEMLESICGATDDSQPVEQYDGTLGVTQAYVNAHQKQAVQVQWNTGLGGVFTNPGNVDSVRWGSGTLIAPDLVLTCGHLFDQSADGWVLPRQNGSMRKACSALVRAPVSIFALMASTLRSGRPTHSRQPWPTPASTESRAVTPGGSTLSRYSRDWAANSSQLGKLTTRARTSCLASSG